MTLSRIATSLRRIAFPLRIGWARVLSRRERVALAALGTAAAAGVLAGVLGASMSVRDQSLARSIDRISTADRAVRAVWGGTPVQGERDFPTLDRLARRNLHPLSPRAPFVALLQREARIEGRLTDLAALDDVRPWLRLRSGRLPTECHPSRCEVVRLSGQGPVPNVPGLHLVRVGEGSLNSELPFGRLLSSEYSSSVFHSSAVKAHVAGPPLFLLAHGVRTLAEAPALDFNYRTYAWVLPIEPGSVHPWDINAWTDRLTRVRSSFGANSDFFDVSAPDDELHAAASTSRVAGRRLLLLGGEAATLLLAFTMLAAASLRRDVEASWQRLTWFGARRWQLALLSVSEAAAIATVGALAGWAAGIGLAALAARHLGSPVDAILHHSVLSGAGLLIALGLAAAATAILAASLRTRPFRIGGLSISALDVAAVGAIAAIVLALLRGAADVGSLSGGNGTGVFLLLLPSLIAFVAAVVAARALLPLARLLERLTRRRGVPLRLATLSLARNVGHAAIPVTFLVVSLGLALFAALYRSTLIQGQRDQAAFTAPRDVILSENLTKLVSVLDAAPVRSYQRVGRAAPMIRLAGEVPRLVDSQGFTLLGIDAREIPALHGWRGDFSSSSLAQLGRRLVPAHPVRMNGASIPADARELVWPVSARDHGIALRAAIATRRGQFITVALGRIEPGRPKGLRARLPAAARGGKLVALALELPPTGLHDILTAGLEVHAAGALRLARPRVRGPSGEHPLAVDYGNWIGVNGVRPSSAGSTAQVSFFVAPQGDTYFRPRQPTDGRPVPVVVSPRLAAAANRAGLLAVDVEGQPLLMHVVATAKRFPSVDGEFVLADRGTLATTLNSAFPGSAVVDEIWLDSDRRGLAALEHAVAKPPFDVLDRTSRREVEHSLRADPLSRGAVLALAAGAIGALALAVAGLLLGVVADLRDERGELFDLEGQGARPRALRRHLRLRSLLVALFGITGGIGAGIALSALVVDVVRVTANATAPEPPLLLHPDWPLLVAATAGYAAATALLVGLATRRAFRGGAVARASEAG